MVKLLEDAVVERSVVVNLEAVGVRNIREVKPEGYQSVYKTNDTIGFGEYSCDAACKNCHCATF